MLREAKARQIPGEPRRRWFRDEDFDLFVWFAPDETICGFQLCYDKQEDQHAFTWFAGCAATHHRVDEPDEAYAYGQSPMLVAGNALPAERVGMEFVAASVRLEPAIRTLVQQTLRASKV